MRSEKLDSQSEISKVAEKQRNSESYCTLKKRKLVVSSQRIAKKFENDKLDSISANSARKS